MKFLKEPVFLTISVLGSERKEAGLGDTAYMISLEIFHCGYVIAALGYDTAG